MKHQPKQVFGPTINRISDVMAHTTRYAFEGIPRLARDAGISRWTLARVIGGQVNPSSRLLGRIATALEREFGCRLDPRDLYSENGEFPTRYTCDLVGCRGCLPDAATDEFGDRKSAFADVLPGQWVTSQYPNGYRAQKGGV